MKPKKYVLWIEDEGTYNLADIAAPLTMNRSYDLTLVTNITDAINLLKQREYDVIIVDLRNLPGEDPLWIGLYTMLADAEMPLRLGLYFLINLVGNPEDDYKYKVLMDKKNIPAGNQDVNRYCILSVDPLEEVEDDLKTINFVKDNYKQKSAELSSVALLNLIEKIAPTNL